MGARKLAVIAKPQLMVITGKAPEPRGQLWIRLAPTEDMEVWSEVNRRSVLFSGADRFALGTYRLMRLAGTVSFPSSQKQARGYGVELTSAILCKAPAYDLREFLDRFPSVASEQAACRSKRGNARGRIAAVLGNNLYEPLPLNRTNVALVQSMLDALPAEYAVEFDLWIRTGFALHSFDDGDVGLALWKRFSQRCRKKADLTNFDTRWAGLGRDYESKKISLGWLRAQAQVHGWRAPCRWDRSTKIAS
jgi:hypothetical protein